MTAFQVHAYLLLALLALCTFWGVSAPFIGESNGGIVLVLVSVLVAWPVLSGLVIARWGGSRSWRLGFSVLVMLATPITLLVLWRAEIDALVLLRHRFPPPRPVFCNNFVDDDRTLLPYWYPPIPLVDRRGHWAWADYRDNVLLIVALGVPETARSNDLWSDPSGYTVKVGPDRQERYLSLGRTTDALIVVLLDGSHCQFPLGPGLAKRLSETHQSRNPKDVLREAAELLEPAERAKLHKLLEGHHEPEPTPRQQ